MLIMSSTRSSMLEIISFLLLACLCVLGATERAPVAVAVAPPPPRPASSPWVKPPSFVRVSGGEFVDGDCLPIRFSGYNSFMLVEAAANKCCGGRAAVDAQLDEASSRGLSLVRFFAFAVLDSAALQTSPGRGSYDESLLDGLDYVVAAAGERGLRLLAVFANNWDYNSWKRSGVARPSSDTKCWYTNATAALGTAAAASGCDDFWSNEDARELYKRHLEFITGRVNRYTGLRWRDDPTIFANELFNEPRCDAPTEAPCAPAMQSFIEDASSALKSRFDSNHLVTVGEDGFFGRHSCLADYANPVPSRGYKSLGAPGSGWPIQTGQDCVANHAPDSIDFIAIHLWPENWKRSDPEFVLPWLRAHAEAGRLLGKPVLLEEFGKAGAGAGVDVGKGRRGKDESPPSPQPWDDQTERDKLRHYRLVYRAVAGEFRDRIKGILFWRWGAVRTDGDLGDFDRASLVDTGSPVFREVIEPFSREVEEADESNRRKRVRGCMADERRLPFVVVGGVAVPRAPGSPGVGKAEEKLPPTSLPSSSSAITKVVSTASAYDVAAAGGRRFRRLSSSAEGAGARSPSPAPRLPPPRTTTETNDSVYVPPPAILGPFWMGSGRKIPTGSLQWVLVPGEEDYGDDAAVEKMAAGAAGRAAAPAAPAGAAPPPAAATPAVAEPVVPIASTPAASPDSLTVPRPPRPKVDAKAINALISCAQL